MKKEENYSPKRVQLVPVSNIPSSYPKRGGGFFDVGQLSAMQFACPDFSSALHQLAAAVMQEGGTLRITDLFRDWKMQAQAHDDFLSGKKKAFAAPPGSSFHGAGRAVDLDIFHLNFSNVPQAEHLRKLWELALPLGFRPIIAKPDMTQSEAWHFDFPGNDWSHCYDKLHNKDVAKMCILDIGRWDDPDVEPERLKTMFLQSQLNRVLQQGPRVDGISGPMTFECLKRMHLDLLSIDEQIGILSKMSPRSA